MESFNLVEENTERENRTLTLKSFYVIDINCRIHENENFYQVLLVAIYPPLFNTSFLPEGHQNVYTGTSAIPLT